MVVGEENGEGTPEDGKEDRTGGSTKLGNVKEDEKEEEGCRSDMDVNDVGDSGDEG